MEEIPKNQKAREEMLKRYGDYIQHEINSIRLIQQYWCEMYKRLEILAVISIISTFIAMAFLLAK